MAEQPDRDLLGGAPLGRRDVLPALACAAVVLVVALVWRSPITPTDPWHYVRSALEFPSADWVPLGFTRYGLVLANIPPAFLFKNAQASYYFWPLVSAAVLAAALYLTGRRLFGAVAGVTAVVLTFTTPIVLFNLTRGYPDIMSIAIVLAAVVTALMARDLGFEGRAAVLWLLATGFLLGWSFEVRETGLLAWPIVLAILWRRGSVLRTYALVAAPVLGWAALDVLISGVVYGDPLLKLHTLVGTNPTGAGSVPPPSPYRVDEDERTRLGFFLAIPRALLERPDGLWVLVGGVLAVVAVLVPNRALRLVSAGFIAVYGLNLLAGGVLVPSRPFGTLVNPRYWIQYFPFIALAVAGLVSVVASWVRDRVRARAADPDAPATARRSRRAGLGVAAVLTVLVAVVPTTYAVRYLTAGPAFAANGGDAMEQLRDHLADEDFAVGEVWTDWMTRRMVPAYQRPVLGGDKLWEGTPRSLTGAGQPGPGDAVLLYSARGRVCDFCRRALAPWLATHPTVPDTWELVFEDDEKVVQLYRVR